MEYPLMTPANTISAFAATPTGSGSPYSLFCGIIPMPGTDPSVFAYECASQSVIRFASPTLKTGVSTVASLSSLLKPAAQVHLLFFIFVYYFYVCLMIDLRWKGAQLPRPFYDAASNTLVIAGTPLYGSEGIVGIYEISLADTTGAIQQPRLVAKIPSAFDVPNNLLINGKQAFSYDANGMRPTQVVKLPCTPEVGGMCYVVYMTRADLHQVYYRAYFCDFFLHCKMTPDCLFWGVGASVRACGGWCGQYEHQV